MADGKLRASLVIDVDTKKVDNVGDQIDKLFSKRHELNVSAVGQDSIKQLAAEAQKALAASDIKIDVRAGSVDKVRADLEALYATQSKALVGMRAGGSEGTDAYKKLLAQTRETRDAIADLGKAGKAVADELAFSEPRSDLEKLADSADKVEGELRSLFSTQQKALQALQGSGKEGSQEYRDILEAARKTKKEIEEMGKAGEAVAKDLDFEEPKSALEQLRDLAKSAFAFEAAGAAADFLGGIAEKAGALKDAQRSLQAQTGATAEEMDRLNAAARQAFISGVGESMAEATKAIGTAKQLLGNFLDDSELAGFAATAAGIGKVFDKDVNEVIAKSRTFIGAFGLDGEQAGNLLALAFQKGNTAMDDVADTLDEYSVLLQQAGFTAEESIGFLTTGAQAGTRDLDKLADTAKETQIRLKAGDVTRTLAGITSPITETIAGIVKAGEQGTLSVKEVLKQTVDVTEQAFKEGKISESVRTQLQVAISGTPAEDIGSDMYARVFGADIDPEVIRAQAALAGDQLAGAIEPKGITEKIGRTFAAFGESAAASFAPIISGGADVLKTISQIGPGVKVVHDGMKGLKEAGGFAKLAGDAVDFAKSLFTRVVPGTVAAATATTAQTAATGGATIAQAALNAVMAINPAFLLAAGIAALVGTLVLFANSGETVEEALEGVNGAMERTQTVLDATATIDKQQQGLKGLANELDNLKGKTDPESQARYKEVTEELAAVFPQATTGAKEFGAQAEVNTDIVRSYAEATLRSNEAMRQGAAAELAKETEDLVKATREAKEEAEDLTKRREQQQQRLIKLEEQAAKGNKFAAQIAEQQRDALRETDIELGKVNQQISDGEKVTREAVATQKKSGLSWKEIAKENGISIEEAKRYAAEQKVIEKQIYDAEKAASKLEGTTYDNVKAAESLAAEWNAAKGQIEAALNTSKAAAAQLRLDLQQTAGKGLSAFIGREFRSANGEVIKLTKELAAAWEEQGYTSEELTRRLKFDLKTREEETIKTAKGLQAQANNMEAIMKGVEADVNPEIKVAPTANTTRLEKQILDFTDTATKAERTAFDIRENLRIKALKNDAERVKAEYENRVRLNDRAAADELAAIDKRIAEANKKESKALEKARENLEDAIKKDDKAKVQQFQEEIRKRQEAIEKSTNVEIIALKEARAAITEQQKAQNEEANAQLLEQQKALLLSRLGELAALELAAYDAQTGILQLRKEQRGQEDGTAIEDSLQLELQLIERNYDKQAKALAEQSKVFKDYQAELAQAVNEGKEEEANVAGLLEAKKQEIILAELAKGNAQYVFLVEQRVDAETKAQDASAKAWDEWFERWKADQGEQTYFEKYWSGVREAIYADHTDALTDEARRGIEDRLSLLDRESDALAEEYSQGEKSYQEYVDKLVEIARQRAEAEEELAAGTVSFIEDVNARLAAGFQSLNTTAQENLTEVLGKVSEMKAPIGDALGEVLTLTAASLGEALVTGQNMAEAGANVALDIAGQTLTALVPVFLAQIFGQSFAAGPFGIALAAGASAVLLGLVNVAKGALAKKFLQGGEITGGKQMVWVNEDGRKEYVIDHPTYNRVGKPFFDSLRAGENPLAAALRNFGTPTFSGSFRFHDPRLSAALIADIRTAASSGGPGGRLDKLEQGQAATLEAIQKQTNELRMIRKQESFRKVGVTITAKPDFLTAAEDRNAALDRARG